MTKSASYRIHVESSSKDDQQAPVETDFVVDPAMKAEIEAAVGFLTDFLVKYPKHEFSTESVDLFRRSLQSVLYHHFQGHWHSAHPLKGSGFRCLRINGKLDPLVARAAEASRLPLRKVRQAFPAELTVWIDPGDVSVRFGEEGSIGVWYAARRTGEEEDQMKNRLFGEHHQQHHNGLHQMYQRSSPTLLSSTPPGFMNGAAFPHSLHQTTPPTAGVYRRVHYPASPSQQQQQYPRQQQSSPVWNPHWQQQQNAAFSPQNHRASPSSFVTTTSPPNNNNSGFALALNHHQQQQMQLRQQQQTPPRFTTIAVQSSPSSRVSPQPTATTNGLVEPTVAASAENGEEQRCKMLAERLMRENLNLVASLSSGLVSSRPQPVGVGVN